MERKNYLTVGRGCTSVSGRGSWKRDAGVGVVALVRARKSGGGVGAREHGPGEIGPYSILPRLDETKGFCDARGQHRKRSKSQGNSEVVANEWWEKGPGEKLSGSRSLNKPKEKR